MRYRLLVICVSVFGAALLSASHVSAQEFCFNAARQFAAGNSPWSVFAADLDGDGDQDLAVANLGSVVSVLTNYGDGTFAPAVLLAHGINDPRVEPWMSAKMTARLQAATSSGKPILFRVDYQAGHGIGSKKSQYQEGLADKWAFLLWQLGAEGFQP